MLAPASLLFLGTASIGIGVLIGAVGVGGVLLVPVLIYCTPLDVHQAMATALASFVATGLVGTLAFHRRGSVDWAFAAPLCVGAMICSYLGAVVNAGLAADTLMAVLAVLIVGAGIYTILSPAAVSGPPATGWRRSQYGLLFVLGAISGFSSGLTGTGGPLVAVPLMILCGFPALTAIGASQVLQVLAALSGTAGNLLHGSIAVSLLPLVIVLEVAGVVVGVRLIHAVNAVLVRKLVAWLCLIIGTGMLAREILS